MKLFKDKRNTIWNEICDELSFKQFKQTMGDDYRSWLSKAERAKQVSKSKRVHELADQLTQECASIANEYTWFQGVPFEKTELVKTLIHAHVVATQEYDHESSEEIEDYLFELKHCKIA
jgi:hypothetical protein